MVAATAMLFVAAAIPNSGLSRRLVNLVSRGNLVEVGSSGATGDTSLATGPLLRGGIGAMISPQRTISEYDHLYRVVARKLAMTPDIVQRRRYAEVNELLERGEIDFAWVCTGAVADLTSRNIAVPLVAPVVAGGTNYRAYLIVRTEDGVRSLEELRGRRFAFTDPLSLTGRAVVIEQLHGKGETPESFFSESFFTFAHDNSIRAVQRGLADGATVDSLVFDLLAKNYPEEVKGVSVVWRSEWFPIPPIMVSRRESEDTIRRLRDAFTTLHEDAEGRAILDAVGIDRFVAVGPDAYLDR